MLDRIININPDVRLSANERSKPYERYGKRTGPEAKQREDSIIFSPAATYLSELDWELHDLKYPTDDKVQLEFVINDFLVRFIIDFSTYYSTPRQSIYIAKKTNRKNISTIISLAKRKLWFIDHYQRIEFVALDSLFEKISRFSEDDKLEDSIELEEILISLELKLNSELQYILAAVFTFLDKLNRFNIIKKYKFSNDSNELVKIEKVTIKNAK